MLERSTDLLSNASSRSAPLRVLVSAYACEPGRGSEPGIGWNVVRELAREFDVCVVTRDSNRASIEAHDLGDFERIPRFVYHDLRPSFRFWKRGNRGAQLYYVLWQRTLSTITSDLVRTNSFDVAHHITFGRYWIPTPLAETGLPFVFGPVGGADSVPAKFRSVLSPRGRRFNSVREIIRSHAESSPDLRRCVTRSTVALGTTSATVTALTRLGARNVRLEPAVGLPDREIAEFRSREPSRAGPVRFVSSGSLLAWKGFELGLRAFAKVSDRLPDSKFSIIGEGAERRRLESICRSLGIERAVTFHGQQPRRVALEILGDSDVLVHPSLHDSGGWVCLEAMAMGLPVVCLDLAGPAVLVSSQAGRKIPATTPADTIEDMARSLLELGSDANLRRRMGEAGRRHVADHYSWRRRGLVIRNICREAAEMAES